MIVVIALPSLATYGQVATFDEEWPPQTTAIAASLFDFKKFEIS
jgi:hypothetical protein